MAATDPAMDKEDHPDLARLLAELRAKGYRPQQLDVVRADWEAACKLGAHPDLAKAMERMPEA